MTGLWSKVAAIALVIAGLAAPATAAEPPAQIAAALAERSKELNRLARERPELFEAIGAATPRRRHFVMPSRPTGAGGRRSPAE